VAIFLDNILYGINFTGQLIFSGVSLSISFLPFWLLMSPFLFKLPIYFFHLWLPKAHVEAPVSGSMILAGVLLKLGGYGLVQLTLLFFNLFCLGFKVILVFSLVSMFYLGLVCVRVNDIKMLIAYSSVSHIALALTGLFTLTSTGYTGRVFIYLGHGVCSSGLFSIINMSYERSSRRRIYINKGLFRLSVALSMFTFIVCVINMSAPPTINLFSEILLLVGSVKFRIINCIFLVLGSFMVTCYRIFFFSHMTHGKPYHLLINFSLIRVCEYTNIIDHVFPLLVSFSFINLIIT